MLGKSQQNKLVVVTVLAGKELELGAGKLLVFVLTVRSVEISRAGVGGSGGDSVEAAAGQALWCPESPRPLPWGDIRRVGGKYGLSLL